MADDKQFKKYDGSNEEGIDYAEEFEALTDKQRGVVDYVANNPDYDTYQEVANNVGCTPSYVGSVVNDKEHLIKHRRTMDSNSPGSAAVQAAMDSDENAETGEILPDGMGSQQMNVSLTQDEVFRCIRLLPQDLSSVFFTQVKTGTREGLDNLFPEDEE